MSTTSGDDLTGLLHRGGVGVDRVISWLITRSDPTRPWAPGAPPTAASSASRPPRDVSTSMSQPRQTTAAHPPHRQRTTGRATLGEKSVPPLPPGQLDGVIGVERTEMTESDGSITHWLGALKAGDLAAAQPLWEP